MVVGFAMNDTINSGSTDLASSQYDLIMNELESDTSYVGRTHKRTITFDMLSISKDALSSMDAAILYQTKAYAFSEKFSTDLESITQSCLDCILPKETASQNLQFSEKLLGDFSAVAPEQDVLGKKGATHKRTLTRDVLCRQAHVGPEAHFTRDLVHPQDELLLDQPETNLNGVAGLGESASMGLLDESILHQPKAFTFGNAGNALSVLEALSLKQISVQDSLVLQPTCLGDLQDESILAQPKAVAFRYAEVEGFINIDGPEDAILYQPKAIPFGRAEHVMVDIESDTPLCSESPFRGTASIEDRPFSWQDREDLIAFTANQNELGNKGFFNKRTSTWELLCRSTDAGHAASFTIDLFDSRDEMTSYQSVAAAASGRDAALRVSIIHLLEESALHQPKADALGNSGSSAFTMYLEPNSHSCFSQDSTQDSPLLKEGILSSCRFTHAGLEASSSLHPVDSKDESILEQPYAVPCDGVEFESSTADLLAEPILHQPRGITFGHAGQDMLIDLERDALSVLESLLARQPSAEGRLSSQQFLDDLTILRREPIAFGNFTGPTQKHMLTRDAYVGTDMDPVESENVVVFEWAVALSQIAAGLGESTGMDVLDEPTLYQPSPRSFWVSTFPDYI